MNSRIKYKLTIKVPGTKLLADYLFNSREDIDNFLNINQIKPFTITPVILRKTVSLFHEFENGLQHIDLQ